MSDGCLSSFDGPGGDPWSSCHCETLVGRSSLENHAVEQAPMQVSHQDSDHREGARKDGATMERKGCDDSKRTRPSHGRYSNQSLKFSEPAQLSDIGCDRYSN